VDSALTTALNLIPGYGFPPYYDRSSPTIGDVRWYALRTKPRAEKSVREMLEWNKVESYLPLEVGRRSSNDRRKQAPRPLFARYVFCHASLQIPFRIVSIPGVLGFVGCGGCPTPVPDDQVLALRRLEDSRRALRVSGLFVEGQKVRVHSGALTGLEGRIHQVKKEYLLVVSIELLQRSVCVSLEEDCVERI